MNFSILKKTLVFGSLGLLMSTQLIYAAPEEVLTHKPLVVWDYLLPNYDEEGKVIVKSETSTFLTTSIDPFRKIEGRPYFKGIKSDLGRDLILGAEVKTEQEKSWYSKINKVTVVSSLSGSVTSESELIYTVDKERLIVDANSRAIQNNGEYVLKVYSEDGSHVKVPVELQKEAPELRIHSDFQAVVNQDILFELRNFNYAITNPIYEVVLDNKVLRGGCVDYHVVSNLIRLERTGVISTPGKHTLTVKAKGFKPAVLEFVVKEQINGYTPPAVDHGKELKTSLNNNEAHLNKAMATSRLSVDAVSAATGSSGGSGSGGGGGSVMRAAKLMFDFDMVANAYVLRSVDMETEASKRVIEIWESASKEAARMKGSEEYFEWGAYKSALNRADVKGTVLDFETYIKSGEAEKWVNRPYEVKYVLNNGYFGDILSFGAIDNQTPPQIQVQTGKMNEDLVLKVVNGTEWLKQFKAVKKFGYTTLSDQDYQVKADEIIISKAHVVNGKNSFTLEAEGYDPVVLAFNVEKEAVNLQLERTFTIGEDVVIKGFEGDYGKRLKGIKLNGKELLSTEAAGTSGMYHIQEGKLIINKACFENTAKYVLVLYAEGYSERSLEIQLAGNQPPVIEVGKKVPSAISSALTGKVDEGLNISLGGSFSSEDKAYYTAVAKGNLTLNGIEVPFTLEEVYGSYKLKVESQWLQTPGENKLVLKVPDYEAKTITLQLKAKPIIIQPPVTSAVQNPDGSVKLMIEGPNAKAYADKISEATVNYNWINLASYNQSEGVYLLPSSIFAKAGEYTIKIRAAGYQDLSLSLTSAGEAPKPTDPENPGLKPVPVVTFDQVLVSSGFFGSKKEELQFLIETHSDAKYLQGLSFKAKLNGQNVSANLFTVKTENYNKPATKVIIDKSYIENLLINGENVLVIEQTGYLANTIQFTITK